MCIAFKNGTICDCVAGYYYDENDKKCEKLDLPDGMVIIDDGGKIKWLIDDFISKMIYNITINNLNYFYILCNLWKSCMLL